MQFAEFGRNLATTFAGLCSKHDSELFAPIETQAVQLSEPQHLFLLAYRAVVYELHATCAAASLVHASYLKRVELGFDPKDQPTRLGVFTTERMMIAYETFMYKVSFDELYLAGTYDGIEHDVMMLEGQQPTVAASALFDLDGAENAERDSVRVCLSLFPLDHRTTVAVFSYRPIDAPIARSHLQRVLAATGDHQKYELSRILLNHCSNFVLSPAHFESWTERKRAVVKEYFTKTILRGNLDYEHPDLNVFSAA